MRHRLYRVSMMLKSSVRAIVFFLLSTTLGTALGCLPSDPGQLVLVSTELTAGQPGELLLSYRPGPQRMGEGEGIRIQLPTAWYTKNCCPMIDNFAPYQSKDPEAANYFNVLDTIPGVEFSYQTVNGRRLDGLGNRFISILEIFLRRGSLSPDDEITILIRGWKEGDAFLVPRAGGSGLIQADLVSPFSLGKRIPLPPVELNVLAGTPRELFLAVPSIGRVNETMQVKMRLLDEFYNACISWPGPVSLDFSPQIQGLPKRLTKDQLSAYTDGLVVLPFKVTQPGWFTVRADIEGLEPAESNPIKIVLEEPEERIFWGDLHSHSEISKDGMGTHPFLYAGDASLLDFYCLTEHHSLLDPGYPRDILFTQEEWDSIKRQVRDLYAPGSFVSLLGFENSASTPSGHHNIYYPTDEGPLLLVHQLDTTWEQESPYDALLIQHHPGIAWRSNTVPPWLSYLLALVKGDYVDWNAYKEVPRPAVEVYSLHGQSEYLNPFDSLAYENCDLTLPRNPDGSKCQTGYSMIGPHYAQDAWRAGLKLGTVAGSDDHRAQPGKRGGGLTAVLTHELTRQDVFEAIRDRHTYATTGDRIILNFTINGAMMGSEIATPTSPEIRVEVRATSRIKYVQVMRYVSGDRYWRVLAEVRPDSRDISFTTSDPSFSTDAVYYVRLEQDNLVHGRVVRAWSSPIWVTDGH